MCVSVCPAPRVLPLRATERPTEGIYLRLRCNLGNTLNMAFSLKILCSKVEKAKVFAYRDNISPDILKTGPFLLLSKSNGRLQATWSSKAASYLSAVQ